MFGLTLVPDKNKQLFIGNASTRNKKGSGASPAITPADYTAGGIRLPSDARRVCPELNPETRIPIEILLYRFSSKVQEQGETCEEGKQVKRGKGRE